MTWTGVARYVYSDSRHLAARQLTGQCADYGAVVVGVAVVSAGMIALGFITHDRIFESGAGVAAFFAVVLLVVVCAVIENLYDLRGILHEEFGQ